MHKLPYSGRGRLSALTLPPATHALLSEATDFEAPPSQRAIPKCALDYLGPRVVMTTHVSYVYPFYAKLRCCAKIAKKFDCFMRVIAGIYMTMLTSLRTGLPW
jgi:hypothetical protein